MDLSLQSNDELLEKAEQLAEEGVSDEARHLVSVLFRQELSDLQLCRLGYVANEIDQTEAGEKAFLAAIAKNPKFSCPYEALGSLYLDRNEFQKAIDYFEQALRLDEQAYTLSLVGVAYDSLGLTDAARESYQKALRLDPNDEETLYNLAITFKWKQVEQALPYFQKALEVNPEYANAHRELGMIYFKLKNFSDAECHLKKALELDQTNGWAYIYWGHLLQAQDKIKEAEEAFHKATIVWPDQSETFWTLGDFFLNQGRIKEAKQVYEKAVEVDPTDSNANYRLGLISKEVGELAKAKSYLEHTICVEPTHERAKNLLQEINDFLKVGID